MTKGKDSSTKMQSTYYLKPGQTLENTKVGDRSLALVLSKNAFDRFVDYTTENDRMAAAAEKEAAKLAALKKATHEMSKSWDDTIANIKKRRKEEILNRGKKEEEAKARILADLKAKNAVERAKIVNEARKLLLWRRPQCRIINGAFLASDCYRQLNAQVAFNRSLREIDIEREKEYGKIVNEDVEKFIKDEMRKAEERRKKNRDYGAELKRQIQEIGNDVKRLELHELEDDKEDLKNMAKELRMVESCEVQQVAKRKNELREVFMTAINDRKLREMELRRTEDFENRALEVLVRSRDRIRKIGKQRMKRAMEEKLRANELNAKKFMAAQESPEHAEEESRKRAAAEMEKLEREKREAKRKHEEMVRADMEKYREELAAAKELRTEEEKNLIAWETLQRLKRDEYNRQVEQERAKRQWELKKETAAHLRKQMNERKAELKRQEIMDNDAILTKQVIESTNKKVLSYGEQVLKECSELNEPAMPLFPILKAIATFKKDSGLLPPKKYEEREPPKKKNRKRTFCTKPVPLEQIIYV